MGLFDLNETQSLHTGNETIDCFAGTSFDDIRNRGRVVTWPRPKITRLAEAMAALNGVKPSVVEAALRITALPLRTSKL